MAVRRGYKQNTEHVRRRVAARLATLTQKPKPVSKEWLEEQYVALQRDCVQIGRQLDKDPKTIWAWLKYYGIPTRPRGNQSHKGQPPDWTGRHHSEATREHIRAIAFADGRVPYLRNGKPWLAGVSGPEHPSWKGGVTPERQAFLPDSRVEESRQGRLSAGGRQVRAMRR